MAFLQLLCQKVNAQLIRIESYFSLFIISFRIFFSFSELVRKFLKFSQERMLVLYANFIIFSSRTHFSGRVLIRFLLLVPCLTN